MNGGFRHEYKYLISHRSAELLRLRLPHIMERDPHAGADGQYTIRSLYFDDFFHSAYSDKMSGIREREKYRIRLYNYDSSLIKLEKKEKIDHLTRKSASSISLDDALSLEQCLTTPCPDTRGGLVEELQMAIISRGLRPKVLVDYDRTPFICRDGNTRITLDENLRTRPYSTRLLDSHEAMQPVLSPDQTILEVKFDDFLPTYLHDALGDVPRVPMAISKFALCLGLN